MAEPPGRLLGLSGDCAAIIDKLDGSVSSETVAQTVRLRAAVYLNLARDREPRKLTVCATSLAEQTSLRRGPSKCAFSFRETFAGAIKAQPL